jgi:tRNA threonylcarbamoyladenosine biosynthesis protein TsaE
MVEKFSIVSHSEEDTCGIAQKIALLFRPGDLIVLDGDLGAGKTYFVKGFSAGFQANDPVSSPTFSIANFYRSAQSDLLHIDLYRIETFEQFADLGLSDYFNQTITLIEWGKKFAEYFEDYFLISFEIKEDNVRSLTFEGRGDRYNEVKKLLKGGEPC